MRLLANILLDVPVRGLPLRLRLLPLSIAAMLLRSLVSHGA